MSVKTFKYWKMFCTLKFVPVLHPNPVTLHILFYFFNSAAIMEICKLDTEDAIFQLANIGFWIQIIQIPLMVIKPFSL